MKMNPFEVYRTYLGIKNHFKSKNYNYVKFGKPKAKYETFYTRKDRYFFEKLSSKYSDSELIGIFISNMSINCDKWIGELVDEESLTVYREWKKRNESLRYFFKQDCSVIFETIKDMTFEALFEIKEGSYPLIIQLLLQKKIIPETFIILNNIFDFFSLYNKKYKDDPVYNSLIQPYIKYEPFVEISPDDKKFYKKVVLEKLSEYNMHK